MRGLKLTPTPPMDVAVLQKRGQRLLRSISGTKIFGDGLLERARATSLGLLGATAAVGLAIVALAFNQAWPLVAGTPVPSLPQQEVGEARVAAGPAEAPPDGATLAAAGSARSDRRDESSSRAAEPPLGESPGASTELVVAPASPVRSDGLPSEKGSNPGASPEKPEARPPSEPQPVQGAPSAPAPASQPSPPQPAPASPPATASDAPEDESHVPPWSHGRGHAYGRDDDDDDEWDDDDEDWDDDHGHGYGRDRDWDDD